MTADDLKRVAHNCRDLDDPTLMAKAWGESWPPENWNTDRELIVEELRQADADYVAGHTVSAAELRRRLGLP